LNKHNFVAIDWCSAQESLITFEFGYEATQGRKCIDRCDHDWLAGQLLLLGLRLGISAQRTQTTSRLRCRNVCRFLVLLIVMTTTVVLSVAKSVLEAKICT